MLEIINIAVRTIVYTTMVLYWNGENAVLAFSFAQLASVIAYTISFYVYFWFYIKQNKKDFPFKTMREFFPNFHGKVCFTSPNQYYIINRKLFLEVVRMCGFTTCYVVVEFFETRIYETIVNWWWTLCNDSLQHNEIWSTRSIWCGQ